MITKNFINIGGVIERTTLSRSVIYRLMKESDFPSAYSIKGLEKRKVWSVAEIDKWLQENTKKLGQAA